MTAMVLQNSAKVMYSQSITRTRRTAFVFLIDGSGSMSEEMEYNSAHCTKADVVAQITNHLLFELIERARASAQHRFHQRKNRIIP